jgi:glycosyltransferase involved in cell wall biosynthesis
LRVLVFSQTPPPVHGSTVMTARLIGLLRDRQVEVELLDRRFSAQAEQVGKGSAVKLLRVPDLLRRAVSSARRRPDCCIFFTTNRPGSILVDLLVISVLRIFNIPVVHYLHTSGWAPLAKRARYWRGAIRAVLKPGDRIVLLGPALRSDIEGALGRKIEPTYIPNATTPPEGRLSRKHGAIRLLFFSNLIPTKGALDMVNLAAELSATMDKPFEVKIVGTGDPDYIRSVSDQIFTHGLSDIVTLHGHADESSKWTYMRDATALVFPSSYPLEAQPLTIIEAMSVGLPALAYDVGGVSDCVADGVTGRLAPAGDVSALANHVRELAHNPDELDRLRAGCFATHSERFSTDQFGRNWLEALGRIDPALSAL